MTINGQLPINFTGAVYAFVDITSDSDLKLFNVRVQSMDCSKELTSTPQMTDSNNTLTERRDGAPGDALGAQWEKEERVLHVGLVHNG